MKKYFLILCGTISITVLILASYEKRPDLTIVGNIHMADGIGRQTAELIDVMRKDLKVSFIPTRPSNFKDVKKEVRKIAKRKPKKMGKVVIYEDYFENPEVPKTIFSTASEDQIRITYSMIEYSRLPNSWVKQINRYFDAVVVPDPFLVEVYEKSGVNLPIFVLPLGLDFDHFCKEPIKEKAHSPFVFANFSSCIDRKNHITLVRAFAKAFANDPRALLWINSRSSDPITENALLNEINRLELQNVRFSKDSVDKEEYLRRFKQIDCYVSLSKGEGFSIQPREAMALGIPVIVTDNTGQHTICESGLVATVPSKQEEQAWAKIVNEPSGTCWNCDEIVASETMQEVYNNYQSYLDKADQAREWARQFQYSHLSPLYQSLVNPIKVQLSNKNDIKKDYIITNSSPFYEKLIN